MFRRVYDPNLTTEVRTPDPYVRPLPNPRDARWRRWAKRNRAAGHRLPFPRDEECWRIPAGPSAPLWETTDHVVRPYVQRAQPAEIKIPVPVDFP